jgi:two-component system sensor histidine kinase ChvG
VLKPSLRANAVLLVLAMLVLPQAIVVGWSAMERDIGGKLQWTTKQAANEVADAMAASADETKLDEIAQAYGVRVRVIGADGGELHDLDHDTGTDLVHQIGTLFFGPDGAPTLREFDEMLGPVQRRAEVVKVTGWPQGKEPPPKTLVEGARHPYLPGTPRRPDGHSASPVSTAFSSESPPPPDGEVETGCRTSPAGKLLVCHATRAVVHDGRTDAIYVQESSRRAVRALYDLRYHLARLSVVMLPLALVFSWWMGRRMVRPIEWLRVRVLEKAKSANPRADLEPPPDDEVGDLAKAFNDLLLALDERRRANEAVAADLVHELKNPVAAIRACAESLENGGVDEKKAARLAKILSESSGRLDALVSQFLELARAEAGMPNEQRTAVDVAALARGVASSLEPAFPGVRFVVDAGEDATVTGVAPRLDSVVRNLLDNAASFSKAGDEVRAVVRREELAGGSARVILEVSDDGPGIADADLPRVFDRFFTTRGSATRGKTGTGLGLAMVKAVAEAHGGEASARSTPGAGATFRVVLPVERV